MVQRLSSRVSSVFFRFLILIAILVLLVQVVWESFLFYLNLSIFVWFVVLGCTFVLRKRALSSRVLLIRRIAPSALFHDGSLLFRPKQRFRIYVVSALLPGSSRAALHPAFRWAQLILRL